MGKWRCRSQLGVGPGRERPSVSILSRSPLGEPADDGINLPPPGPLPPSLCWGCHDNQSSPLDAKNTAKTTAKAPPSARGKEGNSQCQNNSQGDVWRHTLSTQPPEEWEPGICKQLKAEWVGWSFPPFPVSSPTTYIIPETSPQCPPSAPPSWGSLS